MVSGDYMVFSGTANLPLAEKVANYLGRPLNKIDIRHFPDGETFCQIKESVRGKDVFFTDTRTISPALKYGNFFAAIFAASSALILSISCIPMA